MHISTIRNPKSSGSAVALQGHEDGFCAEVQGLDGDALVGGVNSGHEVEIRRQVHGYEAVMLDAQAGEEARVSKKLKQ